jgi:hypothetical protein
MGSALARAAKAVSRPKTHSIKQGIDDGIIAKPRLRRQEWQGVAACRPASYGALLLVRDVEVISRRFQIGAGQGYRLKNIGQRLNYRWRHLGKRSGMSFAMAYFFGNSDARKEGCACSTRRSVALKAKRIATAEPPSLGSGGSLASGSAYEDPRSCRQRVLDINAIGRTS